MGFPEQLYQGVGRGWKQGDKGKVRLAPLTPKSLKVQTALMARLGSAHSGGKKEVRPWEADSTTQASLPLAERSHPSRAQTAPQGLLCSPPSWSRAVVPSRGQQTPASWAVSGSCYQGLTEEAVLLGRGL